jgi:hypothetical protein
MQPHSILTALFTLVAPMALSAFAQTTIHVPSQAATIQAAIDQAGQGDTIVVAPGQYPVANLRTYGKVLHLVSASGPEVTTLSGSSSSRVFHIRDGENIATVIEGFTIAHGRAQDGSIGAAGASGGNIYVSDASPLFRDCRIVLGRAGSGGNGILASTGGAGGHGGGVYVVNGSPRFDRCIFRDNDAGFGGTGGAGTIGASGSLTTPDGADGGDGGRGGPGGFGGAVYVTGDASHPQFANCLFYLNQAGRGGYGGKGGDGGDGFVLPFASGVGGDGGNGGQGGDGGIATLYVTGGASALVSSCTFGHNYLARRGPGGLGGSAGLGEPDGTSGTSGSSGAYSSHPGVFAQSGPVELHNTVFWDFDSYSETGPTLPIVEVDGVTTAIHCAARTVVTGTNCFLLSTNPFDEQWRPDATGAIVDVGSESLVPNWSSGDLDGGTRLFDSPLVGGLARLDLGALERSGGEWLPLGCGTNTADSLVATGVPTIGASFTLGVDDPSANVHPLAVPILWVSALAAPGACGTVVPGLGMAANSPGALLVDIGSPAVLLLVGAPWTTPGVPVEFGLSVPNSPALVGISFHVQGALFDTVDLRFGAAEGLRGVIGE